MKLGWFPGLMVIALVATAAAAPSGKPASTRSDDAQSEALSLFKESLVAYRAGHFREAADLLKHAYALRPRPVLLYNLGRAFEGVGELEQAVTAYLGYVLGDPTAPDRMAIQARIETLREMIAERTRLDEARRAAVDRAETETARRRDADRSRKISPAPWSLGAVGVLALLGGATVAAVASSRNEAAPSSATQLDAQAQVESAHRLALGANVAFGVGGALAVAGGIWGVVDLLHVRRARAAALSARLFGLGAELSGRY